MGQIPRGRMCPQPGVPGGVAEFAMDARRGHLLFGGGSPGWYDLGNPNLRGRQVIDNQDQVERLLRKLTEALPLSALASPALLADLRGRSSIAKITLDCRVTEVIYAGDEGGIMCHLTFDEEEKDEVFLVSITHLAFDRRLPIAREISAYQKHRIKRIRRDNLNDATPRARRHTHGALSPHGPRGPAGPRIDVSRGQFNFWKTTPHKVVFGVRFM